MARRPSQRADRAAHGQERLAELLGEVEDGIYVAVEEHARYVARTADQLERTFLTIVPPAISSAPTSIHAIAVRPRRTVVAAKAIATAVKATSRAERRGDDEAAARWR